MYVVMGVSSDMFKFELSAHIGGWEAFSPSCAPTPLRWAVMRHTMGWLSDSYCSCYRWYVGRWAVQVDALSVDWKVSMATARSVAGPNRVLAGNVDPMVLLGPDRLIQAEVARCIDEAGQRHVLNLGHGVEKETEERAVQVFVEAARSKPSA